MSGHSKWANIQHRKGRQDAKKAKYFTKAAKDIILAAKAGGGNPDENSSLRLAITKAKAVNLPKDKIENAIKKGTGEIEGGDIMEANYEGYAPGGVAVLIEVATDNKNRVVAEIRHTLSKNGGNMAEAGAVSWMFDKKGLLTFEQAKHSEDDVLEIGLDAGAEDVTSEDGTVSVTTEPSDFITVQQAFTDAGFEIQEAEVTMIPQNLVEVDVDTAKKIIKLIDAIDENEDVQKVHLNADFPDEALAEFE